MDEEKVLQFLSLAEKLKCQTRHSWTSSGRQESVAEHVYRLMVFAWLLKDEFPDCDMNRVMELALFHDMGEALTGDIPAFEKGREDERIEEEAQQRIADMLPEPYRARLSSIFKEVEEKETKESRLLQAMDKLEALIQHNEADLSTWLPLEYELQLTYGQEQTKDIPYLKKLRQRVYEDSVEKMEAEGNDKGI